MAMLNIVSSVAAEPGAKATRPSAGGCRTHGPMRRWHPAQLPYRTLGEHLQRAASDQHAVHFRRPFADPGEA